ncbi:MAG: hypothetical protein OXF27_10065 [Acidobacteria bacterium]|nr:hypothetical protein [Acidobacteriota bacterium]
MPVALLLASLAAPARAQVTDMVFPHSPGPTSPESPALESLAPLQLEQAPIERRFLGRLSVNPHDPDSVANRFSVYGSRFSSDGVNNPFGRFGNRFSTIGATNPYATSGLKVYGQDGTYLGELSANPYDRDSISNPYGRCGSAYRPDGLNNPFGRFGSPFSPYSATNPYTTLGPLIFEP